MERLAVRATGWSSPASPPGAEWRFRAHVLNRNNGTESIEVVGGRPGENKIRSFGPERIFAVSGKQRGGRSGGRGATAGELSLAEAPQLRWTDRSGQEAARPAHPARARSAAAEPAVGCP